MLGSLALNTIVTFACLAVVMVVGFVVTYPDISVGPILVAGVAVAVVVPVVFFPVSVTLWAMVDLLTRPVEPVELAEALTAAASTDRARTTPP